MEDMRITGLTLNNVGVFDHLELTFNKLPLKDKAEIHIFTGENGTGKTTLLEALTYFDVRLNEALLENKSRRDLNNLSDRMNEEDSKLHRSPLILFFTDTHLEFKFGRSYGTALEYFKNYYQGNGHYPIFSKYFFIAYNGQRQLNDYKFETFSYHDFNPLVEAITFKKNNINQNIFQWVANNITRYALSVKRGDSSDSNKYLSSINKIEIAIGEIIGRNVEFSIDERLLYVMVKLDGKTIPYETLADGYKTIISWLTDLMFRLDFMPAEAQENFTLFLDEIDIHLHPAAQRRILPVIQRLFPKAQIFLTTHSPFVIGSVDDAWVYKFKLDENGNSVLAHEPFLTREAKSYRYILDEVFDINKQFGIDVEKKLDDFYQMRDLTIKNPSDQSLRELERSSRELAAKSEELRAIIGNELRQLSRILKKDIAL